MSNADKKSLAIKAMTGEQNISAIANDHQVSHKFVSEQKQKIATQPDWLHKNSSI